MANLIFDVGTPKKDIEGLQCPLISSNMPDTEKWYKENSLPTTEQNGTVHSYSRGELADRATKDESVFIRNKYINKPRLKLGDRTNLTSVAKNGSGFSCSGVLQTKLIDDCRRRLPLEKAAAAAEEDKKQQQRRGRITAPADSVLRKRRLAANARERRRMDLLNKGFDRLRYSTYYTCPLNT